MLFFRNKKDSLNVASIELTLSNKELKQYMPELVKQAKDLNINPKRLEAVSTTSTETDYKFETKWRDSIIFLPGRIDTIRCIKYNDNFLIFEAYEIDSTVKSHIEVRDTIIQFVHRVPYKLWFIKFGTKGIRQDVLSKNPHTKIIYTEYIKLKT